MPRVATGLNIASEKQPDGTKLYRFYNRETGRLIGKSSEGWTKEAAIQRVKEDTLPARPEYPAGSFGELVNAYLASPGFQKKAPKTQQGYKAHLDMLKEMFGKAPATGVTRSAVGALHRQYEDRPWQGNALLRTLRMLFNFGIHKLEMPGLIKNPAERTEHYETPARTQVWDQPRIDAFLDAAPARLRLAFALLLYTAQRPSDMLKMSRPMMFEKEGRTWIRLRQAKTDELVDVPCHEKLLAEIVVERKLSPAETLAQSNLLVSSPRGKPWSYRNFARTWDRTRSRANYRMARTMIKAAGGIPKGPKARFAFKTEANAKLLDDLQRRDLRRTGVVQLALAGATVPQIAALTGWRIDHAQHIVDTYLPRRGEVALGGIEKWEADTGRVVVLAQRRRQN